MNEAVRCRDEWIFSYILYITHNNRHTYFKVPVVSALWLAKISLLRQKKTQNILWTHNQNKVMFFSKCNWYNLPIQIVDFYHCNDFESKSVDVTKLQFQLFIFLVMKSISVMVLYLTGFYSLPLCRRLSTSSACSTFQKVLETNLLWYHKWRRCTSLFSPRWGTTPPGSWWLPPQDLLVRFLSPFKHAKDRQRVKKGQRLNDEDEDSLTWNL